MRDMRTPLLEPHIYDRPVKVLIGDTRLPLPLSWSPRLSMLSHWTKVCTPKKEIVLGFSVICRVRSLIRSHVIKGTRQPAIHVRTTVDEGFCDLVRADREGEPQRTGVSIWASALDTIGVKYARRD